MQSALISINFRAYPEGAVKDISDSVKTVGVPGAEKFLTDSLIRQSGTLFAPGRGRKIYRVLEPQMMRGRPDVLLTTISPSALISYAHQGLRLPNASAARVLDMDFNNKTGLSINYERSMRKKLLEQGWTLTKAERWSSIVQHSIGVECKLKDWRRAVRQVAHFRSAFESAYILMPNNSTAPIRREFLDTYDAGLLECSPDGKVNMVMPSNPKRLSVSSGLWILELVLRELENQTPSASLKALSESRRETARAR